MRNLDALVARAWVIGALAVGLFAACGGSGSEGPMGPAGAAGPTGATGAMGAPGASGQPGKTGPTGPAGTAGMAGPAGSAGPAGTAGPTGATGTAGPAGSAGPTGGTGPMGPAISAEAQKGFAISPVPADQLSLDGKTTDQLEMIGHGSYIVNAQASCNDCHAMQQMGGPPVPFAGGTPFSFPDGMGGMITVFTRNLTPDPTTGLTLTEDQFMAAMRTGADHKNAGETLIVMPWEYYRWMSTYDLRSIYAYLQALPPVANPNIGMDTKPAIPPAPCPNGDLYCTLSTYDAGDVSMPLPAEYADPSKEGMPGAGPIPDPGNFQRGWAIQPLDASKNAKIGQLSVEEEALYARGSYIVNAVGICSECHTNPGTLNGKINTAAYLGGGREFDVPPGLDMLIHQRRTMSADLIGLTNGAFESAGGTKTPMTFQQFLTTIEQGVHGDDNPPMPLGWPMPWQILRNMSLSDLESVYTYLVTVAPRTGAGDKATQMPARWCAADGDCMTGETCNTATNECIGGSCTADDECGACQTCTAGKCAAPAAGSMCAAGLGI